MSFQYDCLKNEYFTKRKSKLVFVDNILMNIIQKYTMLGKMEEVQYKKCA